MVVGQTQEAGRSGAAKPCDHHGCTTVLGETWLNPPNVVTALRLAATLVLVALAIREGSATLATIAVLSYWLGDSADGLVARLTHTETRTGAELDVLADRLSVCCVVVAYVTLHNEMFVPAAVFLVQFVVLDTYLTLSYRNWSLLSPNYFHLVDPLVYRLNWSLPAKGLNTGAVVLTALVTGSALAATLLALAVAVVKVYSLVRISRLPRPATLSGCASIDVGRG